MAQHEWGASQWMKNVKQHSDLLPVIVHQKELLRSKHAAHLVVSFRVVLLKYSF